MKYIHFLIAIKQLILKSLFKNIKTILNFIDKLNYEKK